MSYHPVSSRSSSMQEVSAHIASLERAITTIAATKRHLANNAAQAKSRIHSMMSRQLETLRAREVWLLQQVELLHDTKDSLLRQQADSLRQALGALTSCRQYLERGEPADLDKTIADAIDRLNKLDLEPMESRHLSFQADLQSMRDAIHSFGHVDTTGSASATRGRGGGDHILGGWTGDSQSLPRAFEDYDEEDDAMFSKTVQDIRRSANGECTHRQVNVSVPKLKAQPSEWLFLPSDVQPPPKKPSMFRSDLSEWLLRDHAGVVGSSASTASLQHWLQEIQTQPEEDEEDGSELLGGLANTTGTTSSIEVISLPGSSITETSATTAPSTTMSTTAQPQMSHFAEIAASPLDQWVNKAQNSEGDYKTLSYFAEVAHRSAQHWLLKQESGCCKGNTVSTCPPVSPDIEDLDIMTCTQSPPKPDEDKKMDVDAEKDVDEREVAVMNNIDQLCRANEVCHTFTDCVCDNNCAGEKSGLAAATGSSSSTPIIKAWLDRISSSQDLNSTAPLFEYFDMVSVDKSSDWLLQKEVNDNKNGHASDVDAVLFPPFNASTSPATWLLRKKEAAAADDKNGQASHSDSAFPPFKVSTSPRQWLLNSQGSDASLTCPFQRLKHSQSSEWISSGGDAGNSSHPAFRSSYNNGQWLCSPFKFSTSTHSASVDSISKPTPKMNPWLATPAPAQHHSTPTINYVRSIPSSVTSSSVEKLKEYLDNAQPMYQWCLTESFDDTASQKTQDDRPIPKKQELPECDSNIRAEEALKAESAKWLLVSKAGTATEEEDIEVDEAENPVYPFLTNNKDILGEWLMKATSDFN